MVWPCWTGPVMPAGVCVSPGAPRSWLIPMTASSPTPQQQNRWKGRRVLAAALIPQPDAYPPEHTHAHTHTPAALLYTLMSVVKKKNTPPNTPQAKAATCLSSCVQGGGAKKFQSYAGSVPQPRDPDSELGRFAPRNLRVKHSEPAPGTGLCRHVRSLKGRERIPQ